MRRLFALRLLTLGYSAVLMFAAASSAHAQLTGFQNKGLVGVGRIPADSFDLRGYGVDTLGGVFSAMQIDPAGRKIRWQNHPKSPFVHATLLGLPDRGFGDGAQNYLPRFQSFTIKVTPYYGPGPVSQNQVAFELENTTLFNYDGTDFTGFDANAVNPAYPQSDASSLGGGRRSIDAEGIARREDGSLYISDEYGPYIYHFDRFGNLVSTIVPPAAYVARKGTTFGSRTNDFSASDPRPDSGRNDNRGLEGLSLTPDGKRLVAALQSPLMQDSGSGGTQRNTSTNSRILIYDVEPGSPTENQVVGEYVFQISTTTSSVASERTRHTPVSEILALNNHQFLILERDGYGRGQTESPRDTITPMLKSIVVVDTAGATNLAAIANTPYDLEKGAPNQISLPFNTLPAGITPVARQVLVNLLDTAQLSKFGLNVRAHNASDANSLGEKWEGMALIPVNDPSTPDDYLLLIGNDNDFKASTVYHNGVAVGTNAVPLDSMVLAYRVTLPGVQ